MTRAHISIKHRLQSPGWPHSRCHPLPLAALLGGGGARFLVPSPVVFDVLLVLKVQLCTLVGSLVEGSRGRGCQPKHTTAVLHPPPLPYPPHTSAFTFL